MTPKGSALLYYAVLYNYRLDYLVAFYLGLSTNSFDLEEEWNKVVKNCCKLIILYCRENLGDYDSPNKKRNFAN